ncbi:MAG TPA: tyrosine-type recombinase/integrase [Hyphomonadaceae bacterium]|jgi:integrase|nr:tyrosine-type recombinase/integrase [Hyphomonadaceae bacterium]
MPTLNLGRREMTALQAEPHHDVTYYDSKLPGFGVRFHASGKSSFILEYRPVGGGRSAGKKRLTIAATDSMKLEAAKDAARDMLAKVRLGADPMAERQAARRAATVGDLFDSYMREHVRPKLKGRTADLYDGYVENFIRPALGSRKADSITRADTQRLHRKIGTPRPEGQGKPGAANRVVTFVSGAYAWASLNGALPETYPNPARSVVRFTEKARERFLDPAEFNRLGDALRLAETNGIPWKPDPSKKIKHAPKPENRNVTFDPWAVAAIRLLVLTGCRLREILHLKWSEVSLTRGLLELEDSKTGKKTVVLPLAAVDILKGLDRVGVYVIAGESAGTDEERPRHDLQRPWARITEHAGLAGLRIHDLRHSFASVGVAGGLNLPIVGKLLGHANVTTTQRYAHLRDDPVRAAANAIAGTIKAAMDGVAA